MHVLNHSEAKAGPVVLMSESLGGSGSGTYYRVLELKPKGPLISDKFGSGMVPVISADTLNGKLLLQFPKGLSNLIIETGMGTAATNQIPKESVVDGMFFHDKYPPATSRDREIFDKVNEADRLMSEGQRAKAKPLVQALLNEVRQNSPTAERPNEERYSIYLYNSLKYWANTLKIPIVQKKPQNE
ncbi:MAG: hypothetical protein WBN77_11655 [Desulfobacterales bacterium]